MSADPVRVLVVDDDDAIRASLRFLLEDVGYAVDEAEHGGLALSYLRASRGPRVVLLDLLMPDTDGRGVLEAAVADGALAARHAYVLMTAGARTLPLAVANLLARLHVPVLPKPFEMEEVLRTVADAARRLAASGA